MTVQAQNLATAGKLDAFSCAAGTGGTITGVGTYLRGMDKNIKIALTDPEGAALFGIIQRGSCVALVVRSRRALGRDALLAIWDLTISRPDMFLKFRTKR